MSKKRLDDDEEQQKRNPDSTFQNEIQDEHAKLTSSTTLLDLPLEIHEHILLEAIVSEIRERKLFRCGWKDSADRVAERLRNVCPQWDSVLTTNSFRKRLHAIIDTFPSVEISLTVQLGFLYPTCTWCIGLEVLNDEYFFLCHPPEKHAFIKVCDRDDLKKVKGMIELPHAVTVPWNLLACSVSSCVYVMHKASDSVDILRVSKEGQEYQVVPFITCSAQLVTRMCVSADGSLIVYQGPAPSTITTYNADGLVQRQIELTKPLSLVRDIISKSNGNVIIVSRNLTEINRAGDVLHDYNCKVDGGYRGQIHCAVDIYDNVMTVDVGNSVRLLDSDFNQAEVKISDRWAKIRSSKNLYQLRYSRQRNEFMMLECCDSDVATDVFIPSQRFNIFYVTETIVSEDDVQNEEDVLHVDAQDEGGQAQNEEEEEEAPQIQEDSDNEEHPQNEEN